MIIAVSDIHLGYCKSNSNDFKKFLKACNGAGVEHLILLGDIIDFWRRTNVDILRENEEIFALLNTIDVGQIHYIVGNHDFYMHKLHDRYEELFPFSVSRSLRKEYGGRKYFFTHGYELEVEAFSEPLGLDAYEAFCERMCQCTDSLGQCSSLLWEIIENFRTGRTKLKIVYNPPDNSRNMDRMYYVALLSGAGLFSGRRPDETLVFGHTHRPFITRNKKVINTGSWINNSLERRYQNLYLKLDGDKVELKHFRHNKPL
jgi:UDP-2,3-diacylglucosamine pyrophosphatase LpxH